MNRNLVKTIDEKYFWFLIGCYFVVNDKASESGCYIYTMRDYKNGINIKQINEIFYEKICKFCKDFNKKFPMSFEEFTGNLK